MDNRLVILGGGKRRGAAVLAKKRDTTCFFPDSGIIRPSKELLGRYGINMRRDIPLP